MQSNGAAAAFGLITWPFSVVPDSQSKLVWADRSALQTQLKRLVRRLKSNNSSTINLLWADFGAGKTHSLLYLQQLALEEPETPLFPVYTVLPRATRSFIDIYTAIVRGIGFNRLVQAYQSSRLNPEEMQKVFATSIPGLQTVFEAMRVGNETISQTAQRWMLVDGSLARKELNDASLPGRIKTTDEAVTILNTLIRMLILAGSSRVVIMIDEFQRIGILRKGLLDEVNAGLHTFFNSCPTGLTLMLSFSFGTASNIKHFLNEEIQSRADLQVLSIPSLTKEDANIFVNDLLNSARDPNEDLKVSAEVLSVIIDRTAMAGNLTPRNIVRATGMVLSEAALDIQDGLIEKLDGQHTTAILDVLGSLDEDDVQEV